MAYIRHKSKPITGVKGLTSVDLSSSGTITDIKLVLEVGCEVTFDVNGNIESYKPGKLYAWSTSWSELDFEDFTFANATSVSDFNANLSTAPLDIPEGTILIRAIVDDSTGTVLKDFTSITFEQDNRIYYAGTTLIVHSQSNVSVTAQLQNAGSSGVKNTVTNKIIQTIYETTTDADGTARIDLDPNANLDPSGTTWLITVDTTAYSVTIPYNDDGYVYLGDLIP